MLASDFTKEIIRKHNILTGFNRFIYFSLFAIALNLIDSLLGSYPDWGAVYVLCPSAIVLTISLFMFRKGYTLAARIIAALTFNVLFLMISLHLGPGGGTYLYYFPFTMAFVYLFWSEEHRHYSTALVVTNLLFLAACLIFEPDKPQNYDVPESKMRYIFILTFIISFSLTMYFFFLIYNFQQKLYNRIMNLEKENQVNQLRSVIDSQEKNNEQLMLELRDNINQTLNASRIYLEKSMEEPGNPAFIAKSQELTSEAIHTLTMLCVSLYPAVVHDVGLKEGLREFTKEVMLISPLEIELSFKTGNPDELPGKDKLAVFRIIQDYITRLLKSGVVTYVVIEIELKPGEFLITFLQDGPHLQFADPDSDVNYSGIETRISSYKGTIQYRKEGVYEAAVVHLYIPATV